MLIGSEMIWIILNLMNWVYIKR